MTYIKKSNMKSDMTSDMKSNMKSNMTSNMKRNYKKLILMMAIFLLIISIASSISNVNAPRANQITINNSTEGGLKLAVADCPDKGTIYLDEGVYSGENNTWIKIDKNITIIGKSPNNTILDPKDSGDIRYMFKTIGNCNVSLINMSLINGYRANGGAILNTGANLTVVNCIFKNNTGNYYGGAIYNGYDGGNLKVVNCEFINNSATNGGAIYTNHDEILTISNSNFENNKAFGNGGVIYNQGILTLSNSNFKNNSAKNGGAIFNNGSGNIDHSNFLNNNGRENGGSIYNNRTLTISNSNFKNNRANDSYNAIFNNGGTLNKKNLSISPPENTNIKTIVSIGSCSGRYGQTVSLKATLTSANGRALSGKTVIFYVDGVKIGQSKTNKNGIAQYKYKIKKVKRYLIKTKFNGDELFNKTESSMAFMANKAKVKMTLKPKLVNKNIYVKLIALGKALINKVVKFFVRGKYVGKAKTNSKGVGLFKYKAKKIEKGQLLSIKARYGGNNKYKTISKSVKIRF